MITRFYFFLTLSISPLLGIGQTNTTSEKPDPITLPQHRIVFQLASDNPDVHKSLVNQVSNVINFWGDSVKVHVIVHGPGVSLMMTEKTMQKEGISSLIKRGVEFSVCENTLTQKGIPKEQMLPASTFVKNGVVAIVRKQEEGWSYIKAGY